MSTKTIYNYSTLDRSFTVESEAPSDPVTPNRFLIPMGATDIKPPAFAENEVPVYDEKNQEWVVVSDYRNTAIYSKEDGSSILWAQVGPLPKGYTSKPKTDPTFSWDSTKKKWTPDEEAKKISKLNLFLEEYVTKKAQDVEYNGSTFRLHNLLAEINNALLVYDELPKNFILADSSNNAVAMNREDLINLSKSIHERNRKLLETYSIKKKNTEKA